MKLVTASLSAIAFVSVKDSSLGFVAVAKSTNCVRPCFWSLAWTEGLGILASMTIEEGNPPWLSMTLSKISIRRDSS